MTVLASITALLQALTAALRAFPLMLAWRVNSECETITERIIKHEAANTVTDKRLADELRTALAYRRRLHDLVCPPVSQDPGGNKSADT